MKPCALGRRGRAEGWEAGGQLQDQDQGSEGRGPQGTGQAQGAPVSAP